MRLLADGADGPWDAAARRHRTNTTTVRGEGRPPAPFSDTESETGEDGG